MSGKKLNVFLSDLTERKGLPPVRGKVDDAWVYFWVGETENLLRADAKGHVLRHVSGPVDAKESYQELFVVEEGTTARVAFSRTEKPLRRVDVEVQLTSFEINENLSAGLAGLGPIFVPRSGKKKVGPPLPMAHVRATSAIAALKGDEISRSSSKVGSGDRA